MERMEGGSRTRRSVVKLGEPKAFWFKETGWELVIWMILLTSSPSIPVITAPSNPLSLVGGISAIGHHSSPPVV